RSMPRTRPTPPDPDLAALAGRVLAEVKGALPAADDARVFSRGVDHLHLKLAAGDASLELTLSGSVPGGASGSPAAPGAARLAPIALPGLDTDEGVLAHMM